MFQTVHNNPGNSIRVRDQDGLVDASKYTAYLAFEIHCML